MTENKCESDSKKMSMLKVVLESYCKEIVRMNHSSAGREMSELRALINYLYYALKTYGDFELEKLLLRRVRCLKWRMFFMSEEKVEFETFLLARELEKYLES